MIKLFKKFRKEESGAVTVDWVVLTAAVVALAGVVYSQISDGASGLASGTAGYLSDMTPGGNGVPDNSSS